MNIALWLARQAAHAPEKTALFLGTQPVASYGRFHEAAQAVAHNLQDNGVLPGDRVALFMKNTPEYLIAMYGIWYAGAVFVPINAKLHPREAAWIMADAGARRAFATPELAAALRVQADGVDVIETGSQNWHKMLSGLSVDVVAQRAPDDLAWLFYTSGTTGRPKGVMITHRMLLGMSMSYQVDCDLVTAGDCAIYAAPLSHGAGLYNMMHVRAGASHVFPVSGGFDEQEVLDLAESFGAAHLFMAPTMVQRLTRVAKSLGRKGTGLRTVIYAGGPMYLADIIEAVDWFGPVFVQIYGQGECPMAITALSRTDVADRNHPRWRDRLGSVGRAQSLVEVRIGDEAGATLPSDTVGEIMVRGDLVMPGYWQNPAATDKTLRDGWLLTGDMGSMDKDGYVTLKDRSKDLIISGGTNIYPREVEETLLEHDDVLEAAVVGRPSLEWGEEVVAFVVCRGDMDSAALEAHCLGRMARFKRPRAYVQVDSLPKNNYGKVLKTELRSRLSSES